MDGQIYIAQVEEQHIFEMAYNQFEYYTRIEEKTAEIANWDLDQEENIKSVGLQMIKFGQKMEVRI